MARPNTIVLRGDPIYSEATATGAIKVGAAITLSGPVRTMTQDRTCAAASAGSKTVSFARENEVIGNGLETDYASGDNVLAITCRQGDQVLALLAAGQDVAAGAELSVGANGYLVAASAGTPGTAFPSHVVAFALEAIDNDPGTGGAPVAIKVEII